MQCWSTSSRNLRRAPEYALGELLYPVAVDVEPGAEATRLLIHAEDTQGFLFEFAVALGALRANIVSAEMRTVDGSAQRLVLPPDLYQSLCDFFGCLRSGVLLRGQVPER